MNAISIAASGLRASSVRLSASAANIANARSTGPIPGGSADKGGARAYMPVDVVQTETAGGGTQASLRPRNPAYVPQYDPTSPHADDKGMVAAPNVSLDQEVVNAIEAGISFSANAAVIKVAARMMDRLLDIKV